MKRLVLSKAAQRDLESIGEYTEQTWGPAQKRRYLAVLKEGINKVRKNPGMSPPRDDIRQGARSFTCGGHVVFYRETDDSVGIIRVLHQRMDLHRHLDDGER